MERTIGPYRILRRVGDRGGMATVYLAYQPSLDRHVALKELDLRDPDPRLVERFLAESRIAGALRHPNIVAVHDFFEEDGVPYISMEFVERGSLRRYVGSLTMAQTFGVLDDVLAGLEHAHGAGVVHRDIKPENLLVTADGAVKIADFGIAKAVGMTNLTETGITVGTPAYMAPEQATGEPVTPATDLHALGVVAFQLFSGRLPFEETDTPMALLYRKVNEPYPPLPDDADPHLAELIARLLAREPADRPQSAREVRDELEEIAVAQLGPFWRREARLGGPGDDADDPLPPPSEEVVPERRWRWQTVLSAAILGAAIVVAVVTVINATRRQAPDPVASATPTAAATATPSPTATVPALTRDESALTDYVQSRLGPEGQCELVDATLPKHGAARARCTLPGRFDTTFTRFKDRGALKSYLAFLSGQGKPARLGACAADGEWWKADTPKQVEGKLIGRRVGKNVVLSWTDNDDRVAAFAVATPASAKKLCAAWEKYA